MSADASERTILVSRHVAEMLRDRTRDPRPVRQLLDKIEEWVRCGIEAGNVLDHKPDGFVLYKQRRGQLPRGQRFIWCGENPRFGFIVDRKTNGVEIVKTALVRVGVSR